MKSTTRQIRRDEAGEPTGAQGNRRLSVVRAVHEPTRNESEGEHGCPDRDRTLESKPAQPAKAAELLCAEGLGLGPAVD